MQRLLRLVLFSGAVVSIGLVALALSPYGRAAIIGNDQGCYLRMLNNPPESARILVIGSSRIRRGVVPEILAEHLGRGPLTVANIAHPEPSLALDFSIIDGLSRERTLDAVVFEVIARSPNLEEVERRLDPRSSAQFDLALSSATFPRLYVVGAPLTDQAARIWRTTENPVLAAWDLSKIFAERIRHTIPLVLSGRIIPGLLRTNENLDTERKTMCMRKPWDWAGEPYQHGNAAARNRRATYRETFGPDAGAEAWEDPAPLGFFDAPEMAGQRRLVADMVALGKSRGFRPVFFYLPGIYVPVEADAVTARFRETFGAELLIPPETLRRELEDGEFYDNSHLNTRGRARFSNWLGNALSELMGGVPSS